MTNRSDDSDNGTEVRIGGCSVPGPKHKNTNTGCEDASDYVRIGENIFVAVVADGVSNASNAHEGAEIAVSAAKDYLTDVISPSDPLEKNELRAIFQETVGHVRKKLFKEAANQNEPDEEFLTTLVMAVGGPNGVGGAAVGDGGIAIHKDSNVHTLIGREDTSEDRKTIPVQSDFWPSGYRFGWEEGVDAVAVFTDGVENEVWTNTGEINTEFFENRFTNIIEYDEDEYNKKLEDYFLNEIPYSKNDDKSLVVASLITDKSKIGSGSETISTEVSEQGVSTASAPDSESNEVDSKTAETEADGESEETNKNSVSVSSSFAVSGIITNNRNIIKNFVLIMLFLIIIVLLAYPSVLTTLQDQSGLTTVQGISGVDSSQSGFSVELSPEYSNKQLVVAGNTSANATLKLYKEPAKEPVYQTDLHGSGKYTKVVDQLASGVYTATISSDGIRGYDRVIVQSSPSLSLEEPFSNNSPSSAPIIRSPLNISGSTNGSSVQMQIINTSTNSIVVDKTQNIDNNRFFFSTPEITTGVYSIEVTASYEYGIQSRVIDEVTIKKPREDENPPTISMDNPFGKTNETASISVEPPIAVSGTTNGSTTYLRITNATNGSNVVSRSEPVEDNKFFYTVESIEAGNYSINVTAQSDNGKTKSYNDQFTVNKANGSGE